MKEIHLNQLTIGLLQFFYMYISFKDCSDVCSFKGMSVCVRNI